MVAGTGFADAGTAAGAAALDGGGHQPRLRAGRRRVRLLPQPEDWGAWSMAAQDGEPGSMLELYLSGARHSGHRAGPGRRRPDLGDAGLAAWPSPGFPGFACWVNFGGKPLPLPDGAEVLLASGDLSRPQKAARHRGAAANRLSQSARFRRPAIVRET